MYSIACSPYGGLVIVVAQTYFLVSAFDGNVNTLGSVQRIIIYGINGVTGDVQFNRHLDFEADSAMGYMKNGIFFLAMQVNDAGRFNEIVSWKESEMTVA